MLFDGDALVHRAFHALPPLTVGRTGEIIGAVYGFTIILLKSISELKPSHWAIAFDKKAPTFRHQLFEQYKAQRPATPEELIEQMKRVREIVQAFHIPIFEMEGFEADDALGTLSRQASEQNIDAIIVTGDADAMQLVEPGVKVFAPKRSFNDTALYDEAAVSHKYGVSPRYITDLKGLKGDPSDNIPGVPGIGEKTATRLINKFGSMEEIYASIDQVTPPRLRELLKKNEDVARRSKELVTIVTDAPFTLHLNDCRIGNYDRNQVSGLFREMEFHSLLPRLPELDDDEASSQSASEARGEPRSHAAYHIIDSSQKLVELCERLKVAGSFAVDTETTSLNAMQAQLVGISLSPGPHEAYYIPVGHRDAEADRQLPREQVIAGIKPILEDTSIGKTAHNGKYDITVLARYGVKVNNLAFDTMLAAHLLGEKSLGLKTLAFIRLGIEMTPITDLIGSGSKQIAMSSVPVRKAADYACADADVTGQMAEVLRPELHEHGLWQLCSEVEVPLIPVLVNMESNGIALDMKRLERLSAQLAGRLSTLEQAIYDGVGHHFNINSSQQLSSVLFEEIKLPPTRKTKSGYSTDASVLEGLRSVHPVIDSILDYRQLSKLKSTYIDALPALADRNTGRIHTSFNQTRTATGRLSSNEPNLQNIPIRTELGREIRHAFIAPPGYYLLAGDYSQIDLRALAHLSRDSGLLRAFGHNEDIHNATAARLFGVSVKEVTPDMRRLAKTVNFGVIYGMSDYGLEQATELTRQEAAQFIASYFEKYPGVKGYLDSIKEEARKKGFVQTLLGRKRFIPEINSTNRQVRESAERMAINMPVQGTSADIIKVAMVNLHREIASRNLGSKMLLQVHDELILEVPGDEMEIMQKLVPQVMSTALVLSIPLKVDIKTGNNWGEMEKVDARAS